MAAWIAAVAPSTPREALTERRPARERLIDGSTRPWEWPCPCSSAAWWCGPSTSSHVAVWDIGLNRSLAGGSRETRCSSLDVYASASVVKVKTLAADERRKRRAEPLCLCQAQRRAVLRVALALFV